MATVVPEPGEDTSPVEWADAITDAVNELSTNGIKIAAGVVSVTPSDSGGTLNGGTYYRGSATVTFASGTFTTTPMVIQGVNTSYPGRVIEASHSGVSSTGFTARIARTDKTATDFHWIAIGT